MVRVPTSLDALRGEKVVAKTIDRLKDIDVQDNELKGEEGDIFAKIYNIVRRVYHNPKWWYDSSKLPKTAVRFRAATALGKKVKEALLTWEGEPMQAFAA